MAKWEVILFSDPPSIPIEGRSYVGYHLSSNHYQIIIPDEIIILSESEQSNARLQKVHRVNSIVINFLIIIP